jgi:hypothetical protein
MIKNKHYKSSKLNRYKLSEFKIINLRDINEENANKTVDTRTKSAPLKRNNCSINKHSKMSWKLDVANHNCTTNSFSENCSKYSSQIRKPISAHNHQSESVRRSIFKKYMNMFSETVHILKRTDMSVEDKKMRSEEIKDLIEKFEKHDLYKNLIGKKESHLIKSKKQAKIVVPECKEFIDKKFKSKSSLNIDQDEKSCSNLSFLESLIKLDTKKTVKPFENLSPVKITNLDDLVIDKVTSTNLIKNRTLISDFDESDNFLTRSVDLEIESIEKKALYQNSKIWTVKNKPLLAKNLDKNAVKHFDRKNKIQIKTKSETLHENAVTRIEKRIKKPELSEYSALDLNELVTAKLPEFRKLKLFDESSSNSYDDCKKIECYKKINYDYIEYFNKNSLNRNKYMRLLERMYQKAIINQHQMEHFVNKGVQNNIIPADNKLLRKQELKISTENIKPAHATGISQYSSCSQLKSPSLQFLFSSHNAINLRPSMVEYTQDDTETTGTSYEHTAILKLEHLKFILKRPESNARPKTSVPLQYSRKYDQFKNLI